MSDPLARVRRTYAAQGRAAREYRAALRAAYEAGYSYAVIGRMLGVSRQAVRQLTLERCQHPPGRLHAWTADDGTECVACNDCGAVLTGAAW